MVDEAGLSTVEAGPTNVLPPRRNREVVELCK
jgi:hypothetical protein